MASVRITEMLMGPAFESGASENIFRPPKGVPEEKLKVICLVVTAKIMFKWYNHSI